VGAPKAQSNLSNTGTPDQRASSSSRMRASGVTGAAATDEPRPLRSSDNGTSQFEPGNCFNPKLPSRIAQAQPGWDGGDIVSRR
jgi:hypothetical protein